MRSAKGAPSKWQGSSALRKGTDLYGSPEMHLCSGICAGEIDDNSGHGPLCHALNW